MTTNLSISRLISVGVLLNPPAAQSQNLSTLLVLGSSDVVNVTERMRAYASLSAVAADFGLNAPEYLAAALWFQQAPQPTQFMAGRWAKLNTAGRLICGPLQAANQSMAVWQAIHNGSFGIKIDAAGAPVQVAGLDFGAAGNLNAVAAIINTVLAGAVCTYNATYNRFEFKSNTTGAASKISFLTAGNPGTDISILLNGVTVAGGGMYVADGVVAESALAAVGVMENKFGQQWYGLQIPEAADADHLLVAPYIEALATKHFYGVTTLEPAVLVPGDNTSIAYQLKQLGGNRNCTQYSSTNAYAVASLLARILTTNYTANTSAITLMYKQEPGIVPETLDASQIAALEAVNCNVFVAYNNQTAIIEPGVVASGQYIDVITSIDALAVTIQTAIYNQLYTSPTKIPQTDAGMHILTTTVEQVCSQFVSNGTLGEGVWNSQGFGTLVPGQFMPKGFYVYAAPMSTQLASDRALRKGTPIQVAAKLAGAVHKVDVLINVNQ